MDHEASGVEYGNLNYIRRGVSVRTCCRHVLETVCADDDGRREAFLVSRLGEQGQWMIKMNDKRA